MLRSCVLVQRVAAKRSVRKTAVRKAAVTGATRIAKRFVTFGVHDSNTARFNPYKVRIYPILFVTNTPVYFCCA